MRIAYVALGIEPKNMAGGVGRKVRGQIGLWNDMGQTARLFALVPESQDRDLYTYRSTSSTPGLREISRAISRSDSLAHLIEAVCGFEPNIIYLRTGTYIYPVQRLFSIAPTILELNSNDLAERASRGLAAYVPHVLTRGIVLSRVAGLIAVTGEIGRLPANQRYHKPVCVIGNGINLQQYAPLPAPKHSTPVITLVGSPGKRWHGVDKLVQLAAVCPDLHINIVGYESRDLNRPLPRNVSMYGFLDATGVQEILRETDVACSSLALHRNQMQEGSTLKVPEALAYGIPILLAYTDASLTGLKSDCILELSNAEDNVLAHAEDIRRFAYSMLGRRLGREDVAPYIDQRVKEQERLAFFQRFVRKDINASRD